MDHISYLMLLEFVFGAAIGSFLNVVALRYDPDRFLFSRKKIGDSPGIGGRSLCLHCKKTLRWFELIPVISFVIQGGRCRNCGARLSFQYPIVEVLSGIIFVLVPLRLGVTQFMGHGSWFMVALWILVFELLLLMSLIDLRLSIIPDEINIFLLVLGAFAIWLSSYAPALSPGYALAMPRLTSYLFGALFSLLFFGAVILITRGRGMGLGDLKLAVPLGFLFGWPDVLILTAMGFIVGALFGIYLILFRDKAMKSAIPFGPFLALGAAIVFFAGREIISLYLQAFHL